VIRYIFREDQPFTLPNSGDADPQVIGENLAKIADANEGELKPEAVVEAARSNRNPLHKFFEWNDERAAHLHRINQARTLIRSVHLVDDRVESGSIRAYESVALRGGVSYRSAGAIAGSMQFQLAVLEAMEKEAVAFQRRYSEFAEICSDVRKAEEKIKARIAAAKGA
jgi:hypothetical protein